MLLLDAGDALVYDRSPAKATRGASSVEAMNMLGYDAATLGMVELSELSADELRERIDQAEFPFIAANLTYRASGASVTEPYVILEVADHRVGILGVMEGGDTLDFVSSDPIEAVGDHLPTVRREADIVIVLSHAGRTVDEQIAAQFPGIDLIVGGGQQVNDVPLVNGMTGTIRVHADTSRPGEAGRVVGIGRLMISAEGEIDEYVWERVWLMEHIARDPDMAAWLTKQNELLQESQSTQ